MLNSKQYQGMRAHEKITVRMQLRKALIDSLRTNIKIKTFCKQINAARRGYVNTRL